MTHSPAARVRGFLLLPYFDIICNLLLNSGIYLLEGAHHPAVHTPQGSPNESTHLKVATLFILIC